MAIARTKSAKAAKQTKNLAPVKLTLLVVVVNRNKAEYFVDLVQSLGVNLQMQVAGFGTADSKFGILQADKEKQVVFGVIRQENAQKALETLEEKFSSIRGGKGIAFTVPMSGTVGVATYKFLSDMR